MKRRQNLVPKEKRINEIKYRKEVKQVTKKYCRKSEKKNNLKTKIRAVDKNKQEIKN